MAKNYETNRNDQTMAAKISGKVIPETAEKTVLRTNPKTAMATVTEIKTSDEYESEKNSESDRY